MTLCLCLSLGIGLAADKRKDELHLKKADMPSDMKMVDDIVYKQVGDQKLALALLPPLNPQTSQAPLMVYIHGGGWSGGDRYNFLRPHLLSVIRELTRRGVVCASIDYRLALPGKATVMDSAADCKDALRFLVANAARFGIDPKKIGLMGSSAGGHLALVTGLGQDADYPCDQAIAGAPVKVQCVAAFYPRVSFSDPELLECTKVPLKQTLAHNERVLGGPLETKKKELHQLSPIELLDPQSPAIFIAHGDQDDILPVSNALAMQHAALTNGVPVEVIICQGAAHCFDGNNLKPTEDEISQKAAAFLLRYLH